MTDRKQALQDLRDKVAAGDDNRILSLSYGVAESTGSCGRYVLIVDACDGSLDAAKALHDAVLPEWDVTHAWGNSSGWGWNLKRKWDGVPMYSNAHDKDPARAWLLSILDALIAKEGTP